MKKPQFRIWADVPEVPRAGQQKFFEMPNPFNEKVWDSYGEHIAAHSKELDRQEKALAEKCGWLMWDVGDWLLEGEEGGVKQKKLRRRAAELWPHRTWHTMKNWKVTARAIESSRRRDGREGRPSLPYSTHNKVEQFAPEHQDGLLDLAAEGNLTGGELGRRIRAMQTSGELPRAGKDKDRPLDVEPTQLLKIRVAHTDYMWLRSTANIKYSNHSAAARLVWWMATEYYKEHKEEFTAERKAFDERLQELHKSIEEDRKAHEEAAVVRKLENEQARRTAGFPDSAELEKYMSRCRIIARDLGKHDKEMARPFTLYVTRSLGVQSPRYWRAASCQQWDALLAKIEGMEVATLAQLLESTTAATK